MKNRIKLALTVLVVLLTIGSLSRFLAWMNPAQRPVVLEWRDCGACPAGHDARAHRLHLAATAAPIA